jgi:hypothetical protein
MGRISQEYSKARHRYNSNRYRVRSAGIEWAISFEEWYQWWLSKGIDKNAPAGHMTKDSLCMQIIDRSQPFNLDNIQLAAFGDERKGIATRARGRARVHLRKYQDENIHKKFMPWHKARAQARYRGEEWDITFEEFCSIYRKFFHQYFKLF